MLSNRFAYLDLTSFGSDILHPEHLEYSDTYKLIRDCLDNRVKKQGKVYLPDPSEGIKDESIREMRYKNYHLRACFVPVTRRTRDGLVAQVFIRKPKFTLPANDDKFLDKITTKGTSATAAANNALAETASLGRCGFHVTYSDRGKRAFVDVVQAEDIITWADLPAGVSDDLGRNIGSVTVRVFSDVQDTDGVSIKKVAQLTQYSLSDKGFVWVRRKQSSTGRSSSNLVEWSSYEVLQVNGTVQRHIPFYPVGAEENTMEIQTPPLAEMAELNVSHYINSADYEEFAKLAGQVTPVFAGLKDKWYKDNIEGKVMFGMRTPIGLNEGATAQLLQAQPNSIAKEAMDKKEALMVAIGARLIEERKIRRTATEASLEDQSYHSILGHIAYNVSQALTQALNMYGLYSKVTEGTLSVKLNDDFSGISNDSEHRRLLLEEYIAGVRTFEEYRAGLRTYDANVRENDEEAKKTIIGEAKDFKKVIAESTMQKPKEVAPKSDNRTKPPKVED